MQRQYLKCDTAQFSCQPAGLSGPIVSVIVKSIWELPRLRATGVTLCGLGTGTERGWPGQLSHRTHVQHKVAMEMLVETWGHSQKSWRFKPGKKKKKKKSIRPEIGIHGNWGPWKQWLLFSKMEARARGRWKHGWVGSLRVEFESWLRLLLAGGLWESYLTSLNLRLLFYKISA